MDRNKKTLYLLLRNFGPLLPKFYIWNVYLELDYVFTQFGGISIFIYMYYIWIYIIYYIIFIVPKILPWVVWQLPKYNLYKKTSIQKLLYYAQVSFTCGKLNLYQNVLKFQNVITKILEFLYFVELYFWGGIIRSKSLSIQMIFDTQIILSQHLLIQLGRRKQE